MYFMVHSLIMTSSNESPFSYDELFFSKTNKKGTILSGNNVFQRVAEWDWNELIGKPHNLIRHPDMPRGVFQLFWNTISKSEPIAAFVKNRSKTGRYYWVVALAMPVNEGYLSVRFKPGGDLHALIEKEYTDLRKTELSQKMDPTESETLLLKRLNELGFPNYFEFMTYLLLNQIEFRKSKLGLELNSETISTNKIREFGKSIAGNSKKILETYGNSRFIPLNLEIQAYIAGDIGKQLAVVASQYQGLAKEIKTEIEAFESLLKNLNETIAKGQFLVGASQLLQEVSVSVRAEQKESDGSADEMVIEILNLAAEYQSKAIQGSNEIIEALEQFVRNGRQLKAMSVGLEIVRLNGRIESTNAHNSTDIRSILDELRSFQSTLNSNLESNRLLLREMTAAALELRTALRASQ